MSPEEAHKAELELLGLEVDEAEGSSSHNLASGLTQESSYGDANLDEKEERKLLRMHSDQLEMNFLNPKPTSPSGQSGALLHSESDLSEVGQIYFY